MLESPCSVARSSLKGFYSIIYYAFYSLAPALLPALLPPSHSPLERFVEVEFELPVLAVIHNAGGLNLLNKADEIVSPPPIVEHFYPPNELYLDPEVLDLLTLRYFSPDCTADLLGRGVDRDFLNYLGI